MNHICLQAEEETEKADVSSYVVYYEICSKNTLSIHITCAILKLVAASVAEAELGALFLNAQEARIIRLTLLAF